MRRGDADENINSPQKSAPITSQVSLDKTELVNNFDSCSRLKIIFSCSFSNINLNLI